MVGSDTRYGCTAPRDPSPHKEVFSEKIFRTTTSDNNHSLSETPSPPIPQTGPTLRLFFILVQTTSDTDEVPLLLAFTFLGPGEYLDLLHDVPVVLQEGHHLVLEVLVEGRGDHSTAHPQQPRPTSHPSQHVLLLNVFEGWWGGSTIVLLENL